MSESASSKRKSSEEPAPEKYPRNDHCVSRSEIDPDALKIMYRLIRHGFKAYLVGGGVRDLLLGKKPKDFDIATDATPRKIKSLFRNCRVIGRRFKLAHVYFRNNKIIEVSTFRDLSLPVDAEESSEETDLIVEQNNVYGTPATDAWRRDLTINALFYELSTFSIIDYVGGMKDLKEKTIRIIGEPKTRYQEDPVRMLRAVRHAARAGFSIEKKSEKAIQELHHLLESASQVRVYEELRKDLASGASLPMLRLLAKTGLLEHLLPELLLNDAVLLTEESYFSQVLERIDSFVGEERREVSTTSILAAIALFLVSYPSSYEALVDQHLEREELSDHLKSCFVKLMVPRKERERIDDLLGLWAKLLQTPIERVKRLNLERRKCIEDLDLLLHWLGEDGHSGKLHELVKEATMAKSDYGTRPHRRPRGEQHQKRNSSKKQSSRSGSRSKKRNPE
ncbi:MAG: polynucleotide adenylyltransferase PcnB [Bdellovibrionales bacterium]|nr:polynucleotide adenylyltransferase PcnB [Bdellovibrionales bacterium]